MNLIEKIKLQIQNFDINNATSTAMATVASILSQDFLQLVYLLIAAGTFYHNLKMNKFRQELEQKRAEADIAKVNMETRRELASIEREEILNERSRIENDNLKKEVKCQKPE